MTFYNRRREANKNRARGNAASQVSCLLLSDEVYQAGNRSILPNMALLWLLLSASASHLKKESLLAACNVWLVANCH